MPVAGWPLFVAKLVVALFALAAVLLWLGGPRRSGSPRTLWQKGRPAGRCVRGGRGAYFRRTVAARFSLADFNRRDVAADGTAATDID
jgi:hypothetical protein